MAIANYTELQAAITEWLKQQDVSTVLPDLIALAESRLDRELRVGAMVVEPPATGTLASDKELLPTDYLERETLRIEAWPPVTAEYRPPDEFFGNFAQISPGYPMLFTVLEPYFYVAPAPDSTTTYGYTLHYYGRIPRLSATAPTNRVLTDYPDLYLYASLLEAQPFLVDDSGVARWQSFYDRALSSANQLRARAKNRPRGRMVATRGPTRYDGRWGWR